MTVARALLALLLLGGCRGDAPEPAPLAASAQALSSGAVHDVAPAVHQSFIEYGDKQCRNYLVRDGREQAHTAVRCPRELKPGERLRLAGSTCMRESDDPVRRMPVRCPSVLLTFDADERRKEAARRK
jgi:hypothetical protein